MSALSFLTAYLGGANSTAQTTAPPPAELPVVTAPAPAEPPPAEPEPIAAGDEAISLAFAAGWQMTELHERALELQNGHKEQPIGSPDGNGLPGLRDLEVVDRARFGVTEIEVALYKLRRRFAAAHVPPVDCEGIVDALGACAKDDPRLIDTVHAKHGELLRALMAADFRLGKAYRLGVELAETTLQTEAMDTLETAFGARAVSIRTALADLASILPPHASRSVSLSIRTWELWASDPEVYGEPVNECTWAAVRAALKRQGELWRALLSGEKQGDDMLGMPDYVRAANGLVGQAVKTMRQFSRKVAVPALIITVLLGGGLAALFTMSGDAAKLIGGIAAAAGAVGITGAGLRTRAGRVAMQLETRLWQAEMDEAIANAITIGPDGWGVEVADIDVPAAGETPKAGGQIYKIKRFQLALEQGDKKTLESLLAKRVRFDVDGESMSDAEKVVDWADNLSKEKRKELARRKGQVAVGYPGFFVVDMKAAGADLWRVREGKICAWRMFDTRDKARERAGLSAQR